MLRLGPVTRVEAAVERCHALALNAKAVALALADWIGRPDRGRVRGTA